MRTLATSIACLLAVFISPPLATDVSAGGRCFSTRTRSVVVATPTVVAAGPLSTLGTPQTAIQTQNHFYAASSSLGAGFGAQSLQQQWVLQQQVLREEQRLLDKLERLQAARQQFAQPQASFASLAQMQLQIQQLQQSLGQPRQAANYGYSAPQPQPRSLPQPPSQYQTCQQRTPQAASQGLQRRAATRSDRPQRYEAKVTGTLRGTVNLEMEAEAAGQEEDLPAPQGLRQMPSGAAASGYGHSSGAAASVIRQQCTKCHEGPNAKADFRLDAPLSLEKKQLAVRRMMAGEMPPEGGLTMAETLRAAAEILSEDEQRRLLGAIIGGE